MLTWYSKVAAAFVSDSLGRVVSGGGENRLEMAVRAVDMERDSSKGFGWAGGGAGRARVGRGGRQGVRGEVVEMVEMVEKGAGWRVLQSNLLALPLWFSVSTVPEFRDGPMTRQRELE